MVLFKKKEISKIDKMFKELSKIINKKDEMSAARSIELLLNISDCDQTYILEKIKKYSVKHNKILDGLSAKLNRLYDSHFSIDIIQEVIDYCFRFGNTEVQENGVLLLNNYFDELKDRYKLTFVKNKKVQKMLNNLYTKNEK